MNNGYFNCIVIKSTLMVLLFAFVVADLPFYILFLNISELRTIHLNFIRAECANLSDRKLT